MKANAEKNFIKMKTKWAKEGPKVSSFVEFGPITTMINQFVTDKKIDLIVMGTKGVSGIKEFLVGSNTEKIVRWSDVPVISVKKSIKTFNIKNIVFPNVLQEEEEELTMRVKELQAFFKATLHIVYFNTPANFKRDIETKEKLQAFAKRYMLKNYTLNVYNDLSEEAGLANFAKDVGAEMIAMATHGRRGLNHLVSGSIAEDAVNHLDCAIWTFKTK